VVTIDTVAPAVVMTSPLPGSSVSPGQLIPFTYTATDLNGPVSSSATIAGPGLSTRPLANGSSINTDTLLPGTYTVTISASDAAGNAVTKVFTFDVHAPSARALIAAVNDGVASGKIAARFLPPLTALLTAAQAAIDRGLYGPARSVLVAFETVVRAASGRFIDASYAALLIAWSADLRAHLP
jgi:hypothetical protein